MRTCLCPSHVDPQIPQVNLSSSQEGRAYSPATEIFKEEFLRGRHLRKGHTRSPFSTGNPNKANPDETSLSTSTQAAHQPEHIRLEAGQFQCRHPGALACNLTHQIQFTPPDLILTPNTSKAGSHLQTFKEI